MDRIKELLGRISDLNEVELAELRDAILAQIDGGDAPENPDDVELSVLEELAEATATVRAEIARRDAAKAKRAEYAAKLAEFKADAKPAADAHAAADTAAADAAAAAAAAKEADDASAAALVAGAAEVPADRKPQDEKPKGGFTVITAGADVPGWAMGSEFKDDTDIARAMVKRIDTMRGLRGGDGDKMIVASASLEDVPDSLYLKNNDAEGNLAKVLSITKNVEAIVAAGGLGAFRETRYDLFPGLGDTNRPVRDGLPTFRTDRGGVRFMRAPTLNDVNGVVGIWTVQNDIDARTNPAIRKPSFRVLPGPEVVVDTQAITMIMTFGNLMTRAYPELIKRHNELGLIAHARVAEQQLLTQIGALSTAVTGRTQGLGALKEFVLTVQKAAASYRNRHRINGRVPLRVMAPEWFRSLLLADIAATGEDFGNLNGDPIVAAGLRAANVNVTWTMDGEAGQDYTSMTNGAGGVAEFPSDVVWYMFAEGTFAFMDGGTLDLGLVRDSTLNAANDYQMFVETFENVVKFGHEAYRVTSTLKATGAYSAGKTYNG